MRILYGIAVAVSFGAGLSVLLLTPLMKADISGGDWLGFSGALIGVGLAVFGAMAVENWKERRSRIRDMSRLRASLDNLQKAFAFMAHEPDGSLANRAMQLRYRAMTLLKAIDVIEYDVYKIDVDDVELWSSLRIVIQGFHDLRNSLNVSVNLYLDPSKSALVDEHIKLHIRYALVIKDHIVSAKKLIKT